MLEAILISLAAALPELPELAELLACLPAAIGRTPALDAASKAIARLAE